MPWRLVRNYLNHPKVIDELSRSYPMRVLARALIRGWKTAEYTLEKKLPPVGKMQNRFLGTFKEEYRKALKK